MNMYGYIDDERTASTVQRDTLKQSAVSASMQSASRSYANS